MAAPTQAKRNVCHHYLLLGGLFTKTYKFSTATKPKVIKTNLTFPSLDIQSFMFFIHAALHIYYIGFWYRRYSVLTHLTQHERSHLVGVIRMLQRGNMLHYLRVVSHNHWTLTRFGALYSLRQWQPEDKHERESGDRGQRPGHFGHGRVRPHSPLLASPQRNLHPDSSAPRLCIL